MEEHYDIHFRLQSIEKEDYSSDLEGKDLSLMNGDTLQFLWRIATQIDINSGIISITAGVKYEYQKSLLAILEITTNFEVEELKEIVTIDSGKQMVSFKIDIMPTLLGAAFGTVRGALYEKVKGTPLSNYPVPMINMSELLSKNGISIAE